VIDPDRSLAQNVADHLLNPAGRLADEAEHLLDAFIREGGIHYSLIKAIAGGEHRWSRITSRVGKNSASVSRPLDWLQQMELVTKVIPASDSPPGNPKKSQYRLADPYLAFWHRFVAPLRATGAVEVLTPIQLWERHVLPHICEYMGAVFENICRTFVSRGAHPLLPFLPDRVGEWWSDDQQDQIDVVALGPEGQVLLGECKWGTVTHQDFELLQGRRDLIVRELKGTRRVYFALFTGPSVIKDRKLAEQIKSREVLHLSAEDMLRRGE
jgi:AAA+ ATPase superfamily predicted ATPase